MEYKKIKPKKIYEEVTDALQEAIRSGKLKPGTKLESVQQLAESFQVGRSAIREALTALKAMGLIEMRQGEGTYVKEFQAEDLNFQIATAMLMNQQDVMHLLEVRKIIETGAAATAAKKHTPENLIKMEAALNGMKIALGNEELGETSDLQFHLAVSEATQNPMLTNLLLQVSDLMQETMKETRRITLFSKEKTTERLYNEHLAIYEAIVTRNEEAARSAMLLHLNNVEETLENFFEETQK
ncbi:FadR family transcriptional regulator [Bacillus timonensis]|uniref:FadR family transcriptional regulator n=1 Tax=Bacillus timonensis TaxID=1033734 RepID=A0A4S3PXE5_9BACI|nr:FadR/GntR family transcriptional regulator [Bacillus timonensis]THE14146.1 FadR family transcriptional regulator [Bacillus timonensis]